jgi:hypothetical protein
MKWTATVQPCGEHDVDSLTVSSEDLAQLEMSAYRGRFRYGRRSLRLLIMGVGPEDPATAAPGEDAPMGANVLAEPTTGEKCERACA